MSRYYRSFLEESTIPYSYLLDTYTGSTVAYSVRKLSSAYSGSCIRVRRSSDNTEQDFGFVSNALDTTSLLTFVGGGSGYVVTQYDQSGNTNNVTNAIAVSQPLIVVSGALVTVNGQPSIKYIGTQYLTASTGFTPASTSSYSFFTVYRKETTGNIVVLGYADAEYMWLDYTSTQYIGNTVTFTKTLAINTTQLINTNFDYPTSNVNFYVNNAVTNSKSTATAPFAWFRHLGYTAGSVGQTRYLSEVIIYPTSQTSNVSNINNNINTHYAVY